MGARGSDKTFLSHCEKQLVAVKAFVGYGPKNPHLKKGQFGVIHYAGKVMYQSVGFLEKNSDAMTVNIEELIATSSVSHMSKLHQWSAAGGDAAAAAAAAAARVEPAAAARVDAAAASPQAGPPPVTPAVRQAILGGAAAVQQRQGRSDAPALEPETPSPFFCLFALLCP